MNTSLLINQYLLALTAAQAEIEQMAAAVDVPQQSFQYASTILGSNGVTSSELYKCWLSTNSLLNGTDVRTRKVAEHCFHPNDWSLETPRSDRLSVLCTTPMEAMVLLSNHGGRTG